MKAEPVSSRRSKVAGRRGQKGRKAESGTGPEDQECCQCGSIANNQLRFEPQKNAEPFVAARQRAVSCPAGGGFSCPLEAAAITSRARTMARPGLARGRGIPAPKAAMAARRFQGFSWFARSAIARLDLRLGNRGDRLASRRSKISSRRGQVSGVKRVESRRARHRVKRCSLGFGNGDSGAAKPQSRIPNSDYCALPYSN